MFANLTNRYIFTMTNEKENKIVVFEKNRNGTIQLKEEVLTGGKGTGAAMVDPLGSQGSIVATDCFLYCVNAGDNTISSFCVTNCGLVLKDTVSSHGVFPNSLDVLDCMLYVTNVGDNTHPSNVAGFMIHDSGRIKFAFETPLSRANVAPGCITACYRCNKLVVSEKATNLLSVFGVRENGRLTTPVENPSHGNTPFGSVCAGPFLFVTEAGPNALSSYEVRRDGHLKTVSGSVLNGQSATCWVSVTPENDFAYTSNAGSGTISIYKIHSDGKLQLEESVPSIPGATGAPLDSAIDDDGKFFYVLNGATGSISVFEIGKNGHLSLIQVYQGTHLPHPGAQGLAIV